MGGDFNVDFNRQRLHTSILGSFCDNNGLTPVDRHSSCTVDYSYNFNVSRFSILDHFLLSGTLYCNNVDSNFVLHDADNLSDHDPIILQLSLAMNLVCLANRVYTRHTSWAKATSQDCDKYKGLLSEKLCEIDLPVDAISCKNMNCSSAEHKRSINAYAGSIITECYEAANATIPVTSSRQASSCIPGWTEHVKPFRDKSIFWHNLWMECGRPMTGVVAESMRRTRAAYHYAIRRIKKDEDNIIRERLANCIVENKQRTFWMEIKRIRSKKAVRVGLLMAILMPRV